MPRAKGCGRPATVPTASTNTPNALCRVHLTCWVSPTWQRRCKVNNQDAYRRSQYFRKEVAVNNGEQRGLGGPVTVTATLGNDSTSTSGHVFVPKTPETFHV
jgi:hypothetical protein